MALIVPTLIITGWVPKIRIYIKLFFNTILTFIHLIKIPSAYSISRYSPKRTKINKQNIWTPPIYLVFESAPVFIWAYIKPLNLQNLRKRHLWNLDVKLSLLKVVAIVKNFFLLFFFLKLINLACTAVNVAFLNFYFISSWNKRSHQNHGKTNVKSFSFDLKWTSPKNHRILNEIKFLWNMWRYTCCCWAPKGAFTYYVIK